MAQFLEEELPPNAYISVEPPEHEEDRAHRHVLERRNQVKDFVLIGCGVVFAFMAMGFSIVYTLNQPSPELQRDGLALVGFVFSGVLGFLAGWGATKRVGK
jgi:hypothetical protein